MKRSGPRRGRWLVAIGLAVCLVLGAAFAILRVELDGEGLADEIATVLNKRMRGRIEVGSIEWPVSALKTAITGGWVPVTIHDVKLWDDCALSADMQRADPDTMRTSDPNEECTADDHPDPTGHRKPRKLLISTPLVTAEIDIHAVMFGKHDLVFRNIWVHGGETVIEQTTEPYPLTAYDRTIISIVSAFRPRLKAGFRAGIYADTAPPIFNLHDIHIENVNVSIHLSPYDAGGGKIGYTTTTRVTGVNLDASDQPRNDAYLYMDPTDPLVAKFYVHLALRGQHAIVRIRDEGPREAFRAPNPGEAYPPPGRTDLYELELADIDLTRLAQMPTDWSRRDFVANTLEVQATAKTLVSGKPEHGANVEFGGELLNYWDRPYDGRWNFDVRGTNLGPTLAGMHIGPVRGDHLDGTLALRGPFIALPRLLLDLTGLDADVYLSPEQPPLELTLAEVKGSIDLVNDAGTIDKTRAVVRGEQGGELDLSATFGLKPLTITAVVDIDKPIQLAPWLPPDIGRTVGSWVSGHVSARGDLDLGFQLENMKLAVGRTPTDRSIRMHGGTITTRDRFGKIHIDSVHLDAGDSTATIRGDLDTVAQTIGTAAAPLTAEFASPDLASWLARFGLPALATSADHGWLAVHGPLRTPALDLRTNLGGVPTVGTVALSGVHFENGVLDLSKIESTGLGGELTGAGQIRMGEPIVVDHLVLDGSHLTASSVPLPTATPHKLNGTIDELALSMHGTVDRRRGALDWLDLMSLYVRADHLALDGDGFSKVALCVNRGDDAKLCRPRPAALDDDDLAQCNDAKRRGGMCAVATGNRDAGGTLDATVTAAVAPTVRGKRTPAGVQLGGTVALGDVPMGLLSRIKSSIKIGGLASATLHLAGTPSSPQAGGVVQLLRGWAAGAFFGDAQLTVDPVTLDHGVPGIAFRGSALGGRLALEGSVGTVAPYALTLAITGHRLELDPFVDVAKLIGWPEPIQAWASGTVTVKTELAPRNAKTFQPEAWVELTELVGVLDHRTSDGRLTPLRISATPMTTSTALAVSARITPTSLELACRDPHAPSGRVPCQTALATPAGTLTLEGKAAPGELALAANGVLDLSLVQPLLDTQFDEVSGTAELHAAVTGTMAQPTYDAELRLKDVAVRPAGQETVVKLPSGLLKLGNGSLGFNDVVLRVDDTYVGQAAELKIHGGIGLSGLTPVSWGVLIEGKIAGKMLLAIAPVLCDKCALFSQASGVASIEDYIVLSGKGRQPQVNGTITFDGPQPLSLIPRGVHREIAFSRGNINVGTANAGEHRTYTIDIADVTGSIDGEGGFSNIHGTIALRDGVLAEAELALQADSVPFRIPGTLDLTIGGDLDIRIPSQGARWEVGGNIAVVSGKFTRDYNITDVLKPAATSSAAAKPFWESYPSLGAADLDLALEVRSFEVHNNIANDLGDPIQLTGPHIRILGTPRDPRLSGNIRVVHGTFKIPGTRASFTRTSGTVDFAEDHHAGNPQLDITSDSNFTDLSGQDHVITMTLTGWLDNPQLDLHTSTGYNKSQTMALLFLGRNPEQLRRSLGDQNLGSDPTHVDPTTNPSTGFGDQIVKDLAGDWVSGLLGQSLTKLTGLDVLRFELGFGSIGVHAQKKILDNFRLLGDYEEGLRGSSRNVRAQLKTGGPYKVTLEGAYLEKLFNDPAEQDIQDYQLKLVYRLFIP